MSNSTSKTQFDDDGFIVIRNFLPTEEFATLTRNVDRFIRDVVPGLSSAFAFYEDRERPETLKQLSHMEDDSFFADYRSHPLWLQTAKTLLGEDVAVQGIEWFNKPPNTDHVTPPHQDNYYFCLTPPRVLTMWLALEAIDEENGCLRYIKGSHADGRRPHNRTSTLGFSQGLADFGQKDTDREVAIIAQPNDLLIHHGYTIHRADANTSSTRHRRSFAMVIKGVSCQRDEAAYQTYLEASNQQRTELVGET
ncbi:MAG: phytanoyl-CoA dioxygenase family protein [Planctomycetaceae bacterium]